MKPVAETLGVSRPHLSSSSKRPGKLRGPYRCCDDEVLLERIRTIVEERPTYGYRRVTALLNRQQPRQRVNHKRIYRLMKVVQLLLPKYGVKPQRPHEGKVITLASDLRWCSDGFEILRESIQVVFAVLPIDNL